MPEFSVVIITYNKSYELGMVLTSLWKQDFENMEKVEVVVIDDGSTDDTRAVAEGLSDKLNLRYFHYPHTGIRARLRNLGAEKSLGKRLVFLDGDIIAGPNLLRNHELATRGNPLVLSLGVRRNLTAYDRNYLTPGIVQEHFEIIEGFPSFGDERQAILDEVEKLGLDLSNKWTLVYSHNFCVWKEMFDKAGGFDEVFSRYWGVEDIELGYRLVKAGCRITVNQEAVGYHLTHPVNQDKNILDMRRNLDLFLEKHANYEGELFRHEYKIWGNEYFTLMEGARKGEQLIHSLGKHSFPLGEPIGPTASFGILDERLVNHGNVRVVFSSSATGDHPKFKPLLGLKTQYSDKEFDLALVSGNYGRLSPAILEMALVEAQRIAKRVEVVEEAAKKKKASTDGLGTATIHRKKHPKILFTMSAFADAYPFEFVRHNYYHLAKALSRNGAQVGIRSAHAAGKCPNKGTGFYLPADKGFWKELQGFFDHHLNYFDEEVPSIFDWGVQQSSRSVGNRYFWQEIQYPNQETVFNRHVLYAFQKILYRRETDKDKFNGQQEKVPLPIGVDGSVETRWPAFGKSPFQFLWVNPSIHEISHLEKLLEAFQRAFGKKEKVRLKVLFSGSAPFTSGRSHFNEALEYLTEKHLSVHRKSRRLYLGKISDSFSNDGRIVFQKGSVSEEGIRREIGGSHCLVDTNGSLRISPIVLLSIAMGKKPILPDNGAYEGYFERDHFIPVETEAKTAACMDSAWDYTHRYYAQRVVRVESLAARLREAFEKPGRLVLDGEFTRRFKEKFSWATIADDFLSHLQLKSPGT